MENHMKTTLVIDDGVMRRLKRAAAARRTTMSELVEIALRRLLDESRRAPPELPALPSFDGGGAQVDVSDREALYEAMERR
jgi:plasmid stability protein